MPSKLLVLIAALLAVLPTAASAKPEITLPSSTPLTIEQLAAKASPYVVSLTVKGPDGAIMCYGSGFVCGPGLGDNDVFNMVATNYHVIQGAAAITINTQDGQSFDCLGIVACSQSTDIAFLSCKRWTYNYLPLGLDAKIGESCVAIGDPQGLSGTVSNGIVSSIRNDTNRTLIQTTAPISPGSSGGPLLDMYGNVIGITTLYDKDPGSLNFAVSATDIAYTLDGGATFDDMRSAIAPTASTAQAASSSSSSAPASSPSNLTDDQKTQIVNAALDKAASSPLNLLAQVQKFTIYPSEDDSLNDYLSEDDIGSMVKDRLTAHGLEASTDTSTQTDANLDVTISVLKTTDSNGKPFYSGNVEIDAMVLGYVMNQGTLQTFPVNATSNAELFVTTPDDAKDDLRSAVDAAMDDFLKEYDKEKTVH